MVKGSFPARQWVFAVGEGCKGPQEIPICPSQSPVGLNPGAMGPSKGPLCSGSIFYPSGDPQPRPCPWEKSLKRIQGAHGRGKKGGWGVGPEAGLWAKGGSQAVFPANTLLSCLTVAALAPPHSLASLCLRNPARQGLPSPKPTSPWSLLLLYLHSLARAASGRTPTPLPGTAVARQPGVRYPALWGSGTG